MLATNLYLLSSTQCPIISYMLAVPLVYYIPFFIIYLLLLLIANKFIQYILLFHTVSHTVSILHIAQSTLFMMY